ncbi:hypothetical protein QQF64_034803 [Cirrhinus molitorella]|uniref:Calpain catalytic domain-containing protein n=1 Tax=Cirrhinus molitorella TaxID=172907 RepID=A0ABR3L1R1_9TELE
MTGFSKAPLPVLLMLWDALLRSSSHLTPRLSIIPDNHSDNYTLLVAHTRNLSMYSIGGVSTRIYKERLQAEGMGTNENAVKFLNQDYEELKRECLENGRLFEDPCFPAVPQSLGFKELAPHSSKTRGVQWIRPTVSVAEQGLYKQHASYCIQLHSHYFWHI